MAKLADTSIGSVPDSPRIEPSTWDEHERKAAALISTSEAIEHFVEQMDAVRPATSVPVDVAVLTLEISRACEMCCASLNSDFPGYAASMYLTRGVLAFVNAASRLNERASNLIRVDSDTDAGDSIDEIMQESWELSQRFAQFRKAAVQFCQSEAREISRGVDYYLQRFSDLNDQFLYRLGEAPSFSRFDGSPVMAGDVYTTPDRHGNRAQRILVLEVLPSGISTARIEASGKVAHTVMPPAELNEFLAATTRERGGCPRLHPTTAVFAQTIGSEAGTNVALPEGTRVHARNPSNGTLQVSEIVRYDEGSQTTVLQSSSRPGRNGRQSFSAGLSVVPSDTGFLRNGPFELEVVHTKSWWSKVDQYAEIVAEQFGSATFGGHISDAIRYSGAPLAPYDILTPPTEHPPVLILAVHPLGAMCVTGAFNGNDGGDIIYVTKADLSRWQRQSESSLSVDDGRSSLALSRFISATPLGFLSTSSLSVPLRLWSNTRTPTWTDVATGSLLTFADGHHELVLEARPADSGAYWVKAIHKDAAGNVKLEDGLRKNEVLTAQRGLKSFTVGPSVADRLRHGSIERDFPIALQNDAQKKLLSFALGTKHPFLVSLLGQPRGGWSDRIVETVKAARATLVYDPEAFASSAKNGTSSVTGGNEAAISLVISREAGFSGTTLDFTPNEHGGGIATIGGPRFGLNGRVGQAALVNASLTISNCCTDRGLSPLAIVFGSGSEVWNTLAQLLGCPVESRSLTQQANPNVDMVLCRGTSPELDHAIELLERRNFRHERVHVVADEVELQATLGKIGAVTVEAEKGHPASGLDILRQQRPIGSCDNAIDVLDLSRPAKEVRQIVRQLLTAVGDEIHSHYQRLVVSDASAARAFRNTAMNYLGDLVDRTHELIWACDVSFAFCPFELDLAELANHSDERTEVPFGPKELCLQGLDRRISALPTAISEYGGVRGYSESEWQRVMERVHVEDLAGAVRETLGKVSAACRLIDDAAQEHPVSGRHSDSEVTTVDVPERLSSSLAADLTKLVMSAHGDPSDSYQARNGFIVGRYSRDTFIRKAHLLEAHLVSGKNGELKGALVATSPGCAADFVPVEILKAVSEFGRVACVDFLVKAAGADPIYLDILFDRYRIAVEGKIDVVLMCIHPDNKRSGMFNGRKFNLVLIPGATEKVRTLSGETTSFAWYYVVVDESRPIKKAGPNLARMAEDGSLAALHPANSDHEIESVRKLWDKIEISRRIVLLDSTDLSEAKNLRQQEALWTANKDRLARLYENAESIIAAVESRSLQLPVPKPRQIS